MFGSFKKIEIIFSGLFLAVSSILTPPSAEAIIATDCEVLSTTILKYISSLISVSSSINIELTSCPCSSV